MMEQQEATGRGRRSRRLLALILAIACLFGYTMNTSALNFNGTTSSGGSGNNASSATGHYDLPAFVNDNYIKAPAYRFTVVDETGNPIKDPIDIFKAAYSQYAGTDYHKFLTKCPKTDLKDLYNINNQFNTGATSDRCVIDSDYGLTLPPDTTKMTAWGKDGLNVEILLENVFGFKCEEDKNIVDETLVKNNWRILVEPIYPITLKGQPHALTVTEIAVYGATEFGANTVPPSNGDTNSWAYISNYTNKLYPNALRLSSTDLMLIAPAALTSRASFATIIEQGYGAAVISGGNNNGTPPEIIKWTYKQNGTTGFVIYVDVENADSLQIPVWTKLGGQDDLVYYDAVLKENTIDGYTYNWVWSVNFADHNGEMGTYITDFDAFNSAGADHDSGEFTPVSTTPTLVAYRVHQTGTGYEGFTVYLKVNNADSVYQTTLLGQEPNPSAPEFGENGINPTACNIVLDGVEYNYKYSVSFNEFTGAGLTIGDYCTKVEMRNAYGATTTSFEYTLGYNHTGTAVATEDGKGFYVYADTRGNDSMSFEVELYDLTHSYGGEEGTYKVGPTSYNFRAFVPYEDFANYEDRGLSRYGTYTIKMYAGNEHTFYVNGDKTTTPAVTIHNPTAFGGYSPDIFEFTPNFYTVSYTTAPGYGTAPAAQQKIQYVDLVLDATVPTHPDAVFAGWMTSDAVKYWPGETYSQNADLELYATWITPESTDPAGIGRTTIKVGDVFDPMEHLDAFTFPEGCEVGAATVIYNGVPRDAENKATTVGTGYTVVYNIVFKNGTFGQYRLIVTVLDADATEGPKGFIRFISQKYLDTLNANSKWREEPLKSILEKTLAISEPTDEDAVEVWHFSPSDVQDIKEWINEGKEAGKSREEQNAEFGSVFGRCQTKGKYADERHAATAQSANTKPIIALVSKNEGNTGTEEQENEA